MVLYGLRAQSRATIPTRRGAGRDGHRARLGVQPRVRLGGSPGRDARWRRPGRKEEQRIERVDGSDGDGRLERLVGDERNERNERRAEAGRVVERLRLRLGPMRCVTRGGLLRGPGCPQAVPQPRGVRDDGRLLGRVRSNLGVQRPSSGRGVLLGPGSPCQPVQEHMRHHRHPDLPSGRRRLQRKLLARSGRRGGSLPVQLTGSGKLDRGETRRC